MVHAYGIEAVRAYNSGDIDRAWELIRQVDAASHEVLRLLGRLEQAA